MALVIGMDEAGYGPNLGPLTITAVAWEVPGDPRRTDLWRAFEGVVDPSPAPNGEHLQIGDSKQVYSPARGLGPLERGVLSALDVWERCASAGGADCAGAQVGGPRTFRSLCRQLSAATADSLDCEPWFEGSDVEVPHAARECGAAADAEGPVPAPRDLAGAWYDRCRRKRMKLRAIGCDLVMTRRFNERWKQYDSKGRALSEISMELLARVLQAAGLAPDEPVLVLGDKHGGRNRYHEFLPIVFGDQFIRCTGEGLHCSRYRVGTCEVRFETNSERYLPVALASMTSKYLRELAMVLFNRYWLRQIPGLKPTAGYPPDSWRFRADIAQAQRQLRIPDDVLWRER